MPEASTAQAVVAAGASVFTSPQETFTITGARPLVPGGSGLRQLEGAAAALREAPPGTLAMGAVPFDPSRTGALRLGASHRYGPLQPRGSRPRPAVVTSSRPVPSPAGYADAVRAALARLRTGEADKVVLARSLEVTSIRDWSVPDLIEALARRNPAATVLGVPIDDPADPHGRWLVGASPELLLRRQGRNVLLRPLAGSAARSADPREDARRAQALLDSEKDRREHAYVVDAVVAALKPFCATVDVPEPEVLATPTVWHIATRVTAVLDDPATTSADLVAALHPTPAVGGSPRAAALGIIADVERLDRGCYAGAVGWQDASGDGEWVVAVRCAEVSGSMLRIFGGAGIVAGSEPDAEVAETAAKMRTVLDAACPR